MRIKTILIMLSLQTATCDYNKIAFISDFFKEKPSQITAYICWGARNGATKALSETLSSMPVAIFKNSTVNDFMNFYSNFFIVDITNCHRAYKVFKKANRRDLFGFPKKWLIIVDDLKTFSNTLNTLPLLPSSEFTLALYKDGNFKLWQLYKTATENSLIWEDYGFWNQTSGLIKYHKQPPAVRRYNLQKIRLRVLIRIIDNNSLDHLEDFKHTKIDKSAKQDWGSIKPLLDYCNVDYKLIKIDHDDVNLAANKLDLYATSTTFTLAKFNQVDYIKMINPLQVRFILKKPSLSYVTNIFVIVFRFSVWMSMMVVLVVFGLAIYIVLNVEAKRNKVSNQDNFSASDVTLILLEAVCQQGSVIEPNSISGRITTFIMFLAFMFIFVAYSANIVVLLQSTKPIKNLDELAINRLEIGDINNSYTKYYLMNPNDTTKFKIYQNKIGPNGYYNLMAGLDKVQKGSFVFHTELDSAYEYILEKFYNHEVCALQELGGFNNEFNGYVTIPKQSPYKEIFKIGLMKIEEFGLQSRSIRRLRIAPTCYSKNANFTNIGIVDCYEVILILIIGAVLSLIILKIEQVVYKLKHRNDERKNF